jgi:hypothetical protein
MTKEKLSKLFNIPFIIPIVVNIIILREVMKSNISQISSNNVRKMMTIQHTSKISRNLLLNELREGWRILRKHYLMHFKDISTPHRDKKSTPV